jgi:transposase
MREVPVMHVEGHHDQQQLMELVRGEPDARVRDRLRGVALARDGKTAPEVAALLGYGRRSVQAWVRRYNAGGAGALPDRPGRGRKRTLTDDQAAGLCRRLDAGPAPADGVCALRGADARTILEKEYHVLLSLSAVYAVLHRAGYSCLMPRPVHEYNDPAALAAFEREAPGAVQAVRDANPGKAVEVWFADEARFGQKGTLTRVWARRGSRPRAVRQTRYDSLHVLAAVCPGTGAAVGMLSPYLDTHVTQVFLDAFAAGLAPGVVAVLIWDGAGWHTSKRLRVPDNVRLLALPPYCPELNPVENLWHYLRSHHWSNRRYDDYDALEAAAMDGWQKVCLAPDTIKTVCACRYLPPAAATQTLEATRS